MKRIVIATTGGDAPGLNAVVRGAAAAAWQLGWEAVGSRRGFEGVLSGEGLVELTPERVEGIERLGGTILGAASKGTPFMGHEDGPQAFKRAMETQGLDGMVLAGGDGSLAIARELVAVGVPIVLAPKTIDLDLSSTFRSLGLETAVAFASESVERLHSTAASHDRIIVVEVMGRDVGWLALYAGLAGGAHGIVIPEIPYDIEKLAEGVRQREAKGHTYHLVVVSEGAFPVAGKAVVSETTGRYGGVGEVICHELAKRTGKEARFVSLGHLLRGGAPVPFDRVMGLGFGAQAVRALSEGLTGVMISFRPPQMVPISIEEAARQQHPVPMDCHEMQTARALGLFLGD